MWGLMLKDLYANQKEIKIYGGLAAACSVFLMIPFRAETVEKLGLWYTFQGALCLTGVFVVLGILENALLTPDETPGYQQFVLASPQGVRGQVLSKYYACLVISLTGAFWCILLTQINAMVTGVGNELLLLTVILFYLQMFLRALELPFLFGLGARYGNYVKMGVGMVLLFLIINHALYGDMSKVPSFDAVMDYIGSFSVEQLAGGVLLAWGLWAAASLALFYGSYRLSCLWYRRRMCR